MAEYSRSGSTQAGCYLQEIPSSLHCRCVLPQWQIFFTPLIQVIVCAIASRYHSQKSHIYPIAMQLAKSEAAAVLVDGLKSVEVAQAFLLLSLWPTPSRRSEDVRSWMYIRLAIA